MRKGRNNDECKNRKRDMQYLRKNTQKNQKGTQVVTGTAGGDPAIGRPRFHTKNNQPDRNRKKSRQGLRTEIFFSRTQGVDLRAFGHRR